MSVQAGTRQGPCTTIRNNCVYGNTNGNYGFPDPTGSSDSISADPMFVNRAGSDYHLTILSPCINSGRNASVSQSDMDIDGEPRILPTGGTVDIGADEYAVHPVWSPAQAKKFAQDGDEAYLTWRGWPVCTAVFGEISAFYVEQANRMSGIQCRAASPLQPGQSGLVYGTMATIDGGRVLQNASVVGGSLGIAPIPSPLCMKHSALGGGPWGLQAGITGAFGLRHLGSGLSHASLFLSVLATRHA